MRGDFSSFQFCLALFVTISLSQVALGQPGSLDSTFKGGSVITYWVRTLAIQSNGQIIVGGDFHIPGADFLARLNPDGNLDAAFTSKGGPNGTVRAAVFQNDGMLLIGGSFWTFNGAPRSGIARVRTDGSLDDAFLPEESFGAVTKIAPAPDGKILVINERGLARLLPNGRKDPLFHDISFSQWITNQNGGYVTASISLGSMQPLNNGKILIGGDFPALENTAWGGLVQLNADGTVDSSFRLALPAVSAIGLLDGGKILVATGSETNTPFVNFQRLLVLKGDGTIDSAFNTSVAFNSAVNALAVEPDGKIMVGGSFTEVNGRRRVALARVNSDGSMDNDFDAGLSEWSVDDLALQADGKAVVAGTLLLPGKFTPTYLARFNNDQSNSVARIELGQAKFVIDEGDGTLVIPVIRSASNTGTVSVTIGTTPNTADPQDYIGPASTITFTEGENAKSYLIQIVDDSLLEKRTNYPEESFKVYLANPTGGAILGSQSSAEVTIIDNDSAFEFTQSTFSETEGGRAEIRVQRLGDLRRTNSVAFATVDETATTADYSSTSGTLTFDPGESIKSFWIPILKDDLSEPVETVAIKLVSVGGVANLGTLSNATLRLLDNRTGMPNPDFLPQPSWRDFLAFSLALQADGKVLASGGGAFPLARFAVDGSLDNTFVTSGPSLTPSQLVIDQKGRLLLGGYSAALGRLMPDGAFDSDFRPASTEARSIALLADGSILAGGSSIVKLREDGALDAIWNTRGDKMLLQNDGKVLVTAVVRENLMDRLTLRRLNVDGSADPSFTPDWQFSQIRGMTAWAMLPDRKIIISGWFPAGFQSEQHRIIRIESDGKLDAQFSSEYPFEVTALAVQAGGKVLVGTSDGRLVRLNTDGSIDSTFESGLGAALGFSHGAITALVLQPDGQILAGGEFDAFNGASRRGLVLLKNDNASAAGKIEFANPSYSVVEGVTNFTVAVRRTVGSNGVVVVSYATQDGTAVAGADYMAQTGVITFGDGDTLDKFIEIPIANDSLPEAPRVFKIGLANPVGGALLGSQCLAEVRIIDDDVPTITEIRRVDEAITITWAGGGTLEATDTLRSGANWLIVDGSASVTVPKNSRAQFFRVRK